MESNRNSVLRHGEFYGLKRREIKTSGFVFAEVEDFVNRSVPTHTHENSHFLFVIRGEYEATVGNSKGFNSPTMLYYPAGTTHNDRFKSVGGKFLTVSVTPETDKEIIEEIDSVNFPIGLDSKEIFWLGKKIRHELRSADSLSPIVLEGMVAELMVYAVRGLEKGDKQPDWLKSAYELLRDRCCDSLTVTEIATIVGVHPIHLARTFRRFFNYSPGEYLRKCRIESASNLLIHSDRTIVEIALSSGFTDQSQFTRSFKQYTGYTPSIFRRIKKS